MSLHAVRLAMRSLIRRPGFSLLAIVTIALGAGANAAVFAVSYGILLKPLPFSQPDRLVAVWPGRFVSQMELRYLREHARGLSGVSATAPGWGFSLTGAGDPVKITAERVSADLFDTLRATPLLGRRMRPDEDRVGAAGVLVLSYKLWQSRFGGDPSVIGRTVRLDDEPHEIIAVMPASFEMFGLRSDAWVPLPADRRAFYERTNVSVLVGRLADGVSLDQADREFKALIPRMRADLGFTATYGRDARVEDLRSATTGDVRSSLLVLGAAVLFMLLIAAANLGTLLITRGVSRAREFAVHAALGASRGAIVRLQLTEGLLLSSCGALAGLVVAASAMPAIVTLLPRDTPRTGDIHVDAWVGAAVLVMALAVAVLFGVAPAAAAGRPAFGLMLREGASSDSRGARRARGVMVSVQIALALVLAIGAGLMTRTLWRLQHVDSGLEVDRILTVRVQPTSARYREPDTVVSYYQQVLERLQAIPGVQAAGAIQHLPFSGISWVEPFELERSPVPAGEARPVADTKIIAGRYFEAVGQRLLAGRRFTDADRRASPLPLIVNETFARRYFGSATSAVGQRMRTGRAGGEWRTIVGVTGDVRTRALDKPVAPELYTPVNGFGIPSLMLAVRTAGNPLAIANAAREAISSVDRDVPVSDVQGMGTLITTTLARPQLLLSLLGAFAATGLALGAIGIYGVVAFGVARRRREIGIRMALGAKRRTVVTLVLRESAGYAVAGVAAGLLLAAAASRALKGLLFEVSPTDAATYGLLAAGVLAVVAIASYAPARRAASVNPVDSLRSF
jgi:putative ABC transport system permease protein